MRDIYRNWYLLAALVLASGCAPRVIKVVETPEWQRQHECAAALTAFVAVSEALLGHYFIANGETEEIADGLIAHVDRLEECKKSKDISQCMQVWVGWRGANQSEFILTHDLVKACYDKIGENQ